MSVKERLILFINYIKSSKRGFSLSIGMSENYIASMRNSIQPDVVHRIAEIYPNLNTGWLMTGEGTMLKDGGKEVFVQELKDKTYTNYIEVKIVTTKARAGYSESYYADEYLEDMPTVLVESDKEHRGKYIAFEVDGDSMEPEYRSGHIVICREINRDLWRHKLHYKEWDYVIAHGTKGIMLKQIIAHNTETGEITCHSLNNEGHPDFTVNLREVAFLYNVVEHRIPGKHKLRYR